METGDSMPTAMSELAELIIEVLREHGTIHLLDEFECCAEEIANLFPGVEYCVMHSLYPDEPHRGPMLYADAHDWVQKAEKNGVIPGAFYVARRYTSKWMQI
jgi:hypothetical protein